MDPDERRSALVVAVSDYDDPRLRRLRAPAADAERLAAVLRDPQIGGFEVDVALNEHEPQLRRRIAGFFNDRRTDDLLLVHFSCHGVKDERGELHLAASDTELGPLLGATAISSRWLNDQMTHSRSRRIVMLLDCCFSGSFPFGTRHRTGADVNVQAHFQGRGRVVITASSAMEYAYEGDQLSGGAQPSFFTEAIVEALETGAADRDRDRLISVDELYDYVFDRVRERTPSQTPQIMSQLEGPLYIARSVAGSHDAGEHPRARPAPVATVTAPSPPGAARPAVARPAAPVSTTLVRWPTRSAAFALDLLIVAPLGLLLSFLVWTPFVHAPAPPEVAVAEWVALPLLGGLAYALLLPRLRGGRSWGKRLCGLYVVRRSGGASGRLRLIVREGVKWVLVVASVATVGIALVGLRLLAVRRPDRQFLHDVLAGTLLVKEPRQAG